MAATQLWAVASVALLCLSLAIAAVGKEQMKHVQTFHSPMFELGSGDVTDSYKLLEFPKGHIAVRSFDAEVVDEEGNSVPLYDVYLHHWVVFKLYVKKGYKQLTTSEPKTLPSSGHDTQFIGGSSTKHYHTERMAFQERAIPKQGKNQGTSQERQITEFFGLGSETRHTNTTIPPPYGFVFGDAEAAPEGYEEAWYLNVHAIDTRGAVDVASCTECLCEAYGVSEDSRGNPLKEGYKGGMLCCTDKTHCAVKEDNGRKKYFLKYVISWVDWDKTVVPLRSYVLDATDPKTSLSEDTHGTIEYEVPQCSKDTPSNECIDRHHAIGAIPIAGDLIRGCLHQHAGGLGGIIYDKNGILLCSSDPIYGKGIEAGDEAGYVVGMTACYPEPGSLYLESMQELHFDAYYSNEKGHTGVMSLFNLHVADPVTYIAEVTD